MFTWYLRDLPHALRSTLLTRSVLFGTLCAVWLGVALLFTGSQYHAEAHDPHECVAGYPDSPALDHHIDQQAITNGEYSFEEIFFLGQDLFQADFNFCDGQGRPATTGTGNPRDPASNPPDFIRTSAPDSNSCAGCHNQPRSGGGGDFVANVFVLAQALDPVTESVSGEFSNERNTLGMFGSGAIEMLGREMTDDLLAIQEAALEEARQTGKPVAMNLETKGVEFGQIIAQPDGTVDTAGVEGVDPDLIVKPFHQAGVVRSIREFTVNAYNHHHGMQAEERFDLNPAKGVDYDQDGVPYELTIGDITAATIYQAALGVPGQLLPDSEVEQERVARGEELFQQINCTSCHLADLPLESATFVEPYLRNPAGTYSDTSVTFTFDMTEQGEGPFLEKDGNSGAAVPAYTDLKRHDLCDDPGDPDPIRTFCNEQLAQDRPVQDDRPGTEFFITRKLWDVGNSAPFGHRGDLTTITEAILAHGGEGRESRDAFADLSYDDQKVIVEFLGTLQVLPAGSEPVMIDGQQNGLSSGDENSQGWALVILVALLLFTLAAIALVGWWTARRKPELS